MKYTSASGGSGYLKCARKAIIQSFFPPRPSSPAQARGTALHTAIEEYLLDGRPTSDPLVLLAVDKGLLPRPWCPEMKVEIGLGAPNDDAERYSICREYTGKEFQQTIEGMPYRGVVDLVRWDRGKLEIWDHKTVASYFYAETEDTLKYNFQIWSYAYHIKQYIKTIAPELLEKPIRLGHIQYNKSKKKPTEEDVRQVSFLTTSDYIDRKWKLCEAIYAHFIKNRFDLASAPKNTRHCSAYGGCPHKNHCNTVQLEENDGEYQRLKSAWENMK